MYSWILFSYILSIIGVYGGSVLNVIDITNSPIPIRVSAQVMLEFTS